MRNRSVKISVYEAFKLGRPNEAKYVHGQSKSKSESESKSGKQVAAHKNKTIECTKCRQAVAAAK